MSWPAAMTSWQSVSCARWSMAYCVKLRHSPSSTGGQPAQKPQHQGKTSTNNTITINTITVNKRD
jgi:hypothetical protein